MFLAPVEFVYFGEATNSDPKKYIRFKIKTSSRTLQLTFLTTVCLFYHCAIARTCIIFVFVFKITV